MPTLRERVKTLVLGTILLVVSLGVVLVGYAMLPPQASGMQALGIGLLVLLGLTGALGALFLLLLPAILPVR